MKATELLDFLREFHRDKLAMLRRHVAAARHVSDYEFNNTYQYVIAREEMHVSWVRDAILDAGGGEPAEDAGRAGDPTLGKGPCRRDARSSRRIATGHRRSSTNGGRESPRSATRGTARCST